MTSPADNTLVARAKATFRVHDEMTYYEGHPDIVANELITALEASYAENERLQEALEAVERERQLMAKDWGRFCESMGVQFDTQEAVACDLQAQFWTLREALSPFADRKIEAPYGDEARTSLRIKIGVDALTADSVVGPKLGDFRRARTALKDSPK